MANKSVESFMTELEEEFNCTNKWPAAINKQQVENIESDMQNPAHGVHRRVLLMILSMHSEKLFEACEENPEVWFDAFQCAASTIGKLQSLVKMLSASHNRLMIGLSHVDTDAPDAPFSKQEFFDAIHEAEDKEETDAQEGAS